MTNQNPSPFDMLKINKRFFASHVVTPKKTSARKAKRKNSTKVKKSYTKKNKRRYTRKYKNK